MIEDITSVALLASQAEQSGEPFPLHMLPSPTANKKDAPGAVQLMEHFVKTPSYRVDNVAYHRVRRSIGKWAVTDCLPYRTVQTTAFRAMTRSLDPKCSDFGSTDHRRGGEFALQVLLPSFFLCSSDFFLPLHCFVSIFCHYLYCC